MTRVWLTEWEWACCGDAVAIDDSVVADAVGHDRLSHALAGKALIDSLCSAHDADEGHIMSKRCAQSDEVARGLRVRVG
ncbi:hypothetical protein MB46_18070 [Arthrobacter alpinus]|uniref:hypothetical protein n=1 Tax=Arthrobacter alpinus TaxID=656366 RepID=UPI0005CB46AF|nr:hypothetical protein [Arthrobacter alpinus]ALV47110.1 hypothetical protein MB46_18070 [Arthrobacter alpinus]